MSLLNYAAIGIVKRKKGEKKYWYTVVWVEGYNPVDVTIVYVLTLFFFVCVYVTGTVVWVEGYDPVDVTIV